MQSDQREQKARAGGAPKPVQTFDNNSPHRMSRAKGGPMVVSLDGAHICAAPGFQVRHFEVTVGRVETEHRPARHFAIAANVQATKPDAIGNANFCL